MYVRSNASFRHFRALFTRLLVPVERVIYWKEHSAGLYQTLPYYVAKCLVELPLTMAFPLVRAFHCVAFQSAKAVVGYR